MPFYWNICGENVIKTDADFISVNEQFQYHWITQRWWECDLLLMWMCKTKCPQSQVRRSMRNTAQTKLYGVDSLNDEDLTKVKLKHTQTHPNKHEKNQGKVIQSPNHEFPI